MNDPLLQIYIVAIAIHIAAVSVVLYLWTENRHERFLQFWSIAWGAGLVRWLVHYPAETRPSLRATEGILISVTMFFMVLGSYDLLPGKPWRQRAVVAGTGLVLLASAIAANTVGQPILVGYAVFAATLAFSTACMWVAYRTTRLAGHLFAAATLLFQMVIVAILLLERGREVANSIIVPLYNIPLMLSIAVIAHQRHRRRLIESERTLQKIFETAPTPIVIARPPAGEIERANPAAVQVLGLPPATAIGKTAVEHGIVMNPAGRRAIYEELAAGGRIAGRELTILRGGVEERTMSINADRIALHSGDRYIYSFYDVTDLRRAEHELRHSSEQMRQLYVRLANVEDDERRALHAELHDQVGANLSALRLELDVAASLLTRGETASATEHLSSARDVTAETIVMARNLMAELRPPALDDYGLVAALRTFAESHATRLSLPITVRGEDLKPRPAPLVEIALFRIAHEAVINAARHAAARRVDVAVARDDGHVRLTVEDDGIGFDVQAPGAGPDHWGLKGMRERALAVGGTVQIDSSPGAGTRVTAEAPWQAR